MNSYIFLSSICADLVRLVGGSAPSEGFVEVNLGGAWGAVCSNGYFNSAAATVVCRQLGLTYSALLPSYSAATARPGPGMNGTLPYLMSNIQCYGTEARLQDCGYFQGGLPDNNLCSQDASEYSGLLWMSHDCFNDTHCIA